MTAEVWKMFVQKQEFVGFVVLVWESLQLLRVVVVEMVAAVQTVAQMPQEGQLEGLSLLLPPPHPLAS